MNPLKEYLKKTTTYAMDKKMREKRINLTLPTLESISKLDDEGILQMRLKNILILKKEFNIDMAKGVDYDKAKSFRVTHKKLSTDK